MKPKLKLNFGWKDVADMWWLFISLALLCGMVLYVKHVTTMRCPEGTAYDVETRQCVKIPPSEATVIYDPPVVMVTCSKEIEDRQCAGMVSPECEPECHGACTKASKKAETKETAQVIIEPCYVEIERVEDDAE